MNKTIFTLPIVLISLSSFTCTTVNYEQVAFDYFMSDIFERDFKSLSVMEFKGKTDDTYSTLGDYKFCLKPEEKLQALIKNVTKEPLTISTDIKYSHIKNVTITNFKDDSNTTKLHLYHAVRVADNVYVFLTIHKQNEPLYKYVFELNVDGEILRNCRMG